MDRHDWDVHLPEPHRPRPDAGPVPPAAVLAGLESEDWQVREAACRVAGGQGVTEAERALEGLLADPDPRVRSAAAHALGTVGRESAARVLHGLVMDPDSVLASAAEEALERIAERLGRPDLRPGTDY
ncbi:HEAT repeat domain-containing protein [Citricoccus sp. SGAir0253]|uniref:HEAT repeat domain-containing protein n=1 Tax=Citricoccus sp. SGAir0253 TaxID=2567881 RepID=UPI0010CD2E84|nr:HEAT repeat domain-containing protein [Citricoccus sp. SGAir0253]QCU79103.1 HEAT repeat domain-containing protein [Citricoccus sp. SGAir0253]